MKVIKFANLLAFAIAISLTAIGCKTQTPTTIKFDDQGRPISGSGADQTAGNAGKLDTNSSGISKSADYRNCHGATAIPAGPKIVKLSRPRPSISNMTAL